jgi:putative holliday junction resolvase
VTRLLGLDHGARRIGLAVADPETGMAFSRPALHRHRLVDDVAAIVALCRAEGIGRVVIGLPMHMDGQEGPQAAAARSFGDELAATGLDVVYEDERLSSWAAAERLADAGRRPGRGSGELDSAAARVILQQYLDARSHPPASPSEESE